MNQIELMLTVEQMDPGQRLNLSREKLVRLAEGSMRSLLLDGPVRSEDIDQFLKQLEVNWGLKVQRNLLDESAIIEKK